MSFRQSLRHRGGARAALAIRALVYGALLSVSSYVLASSLLPSPSNFTTVTPPRRSLGQGKALVIGNRTDPQLELTRSGSVLGAQLVAQSLDEVGVGSVQVVIDATAQQLREQLAQRRRDDSEDTWSWFYFGGHALQWGGGNYLLGSDFPFNHPKQLTAEEIESLLNTHAVSLEEVIDSSPDTVHPNVIVIDACQNNPFQEDSQLGKDWKNGLARNAIPWPRTLVAFSAAPSVLAPDPRTTPSRFTKELAALLKQPGATLTNIFPRLLQEMKNSYQMPVYTSYLPAEDEIIFRLPVKVIVQATADDDAILLVNSRVAVHAGQSGGLPTEVTLDPGENDFRVLAYNQRTFTGGFEVFGGHEPEGWNVTLSVSEPGRQAPLATIQEHEDTPAAESRHGKLFEVARFVLTVDPKTGTISRTEDIQVLWKPESPH